MRRDRLSDFNDGRKDFAELQALILQARAAAMNERLPAKNQLRLPKAMQRIAFSALTRKREPRR